MGGGEAGAGRTALGRLLVVTPSTRPPNPTACGRGPVRECPPTGCIHNWPKTVDSHRSPHKAETRAAVLPGTPRCRHRHQLDAAQKLRDRARGDVQTDREWNPFYIKSPSERNEEQPIQGGLLGGPSGGPGCCGEGRAGARRGCSVRPTPELCACPPRRLLSPTPTEQPARPRPPPPTQAEPWTPST